MISQGNLSRLSRVACAAILVLPFTSVGSATGHADIVTGLKAYWTFEETGGTTLQDVHGGYDGTISVQGTGQVLLGQTGKFGNAYQFTGTFDAGGNQNYVSLPATDANNERLVPASDPWTFFAWINMPSLSANDDAIFYYSVWDEFRGGLMQSLTTGDLRIFPGAAPGQFPGITGTAVLSANQWHHVGFTRDGNNVWTLWSDGESRGQQTLNSTMGSGAWHLGNNVLPYLNQQYNGRMDDAAVWSIALTEAEVRATYNLGTDFSYDLGSVRELFAAYGDQGSATIGNEYWWYTGGLNGLAPEGLRVGELWEENGRAYLLLDAAGTGTGMMIPEPATWLLLLSALACGLMVRRRR